MKFLYSFLFLSSSIATYSQVTIGSALKPAKAALLELKTQEPDEQNVTSNIGGLLLSRVALEDLKTLDPFIETSSENYDKAKKANTGLFVYNVTDNETFIPGLYCWDGEKWNILLSAHDPHNLPQMSGGDSNRVPEIPSINKGIDLPNSYMITPGTSLSFPIMKAYSVWKLQLDNDIDITQDNISVELLWQDEKDLIDKVSLKKGKTNETSTIEVKTTKGKEGNALVAIRMNGIIRWSWHLWVTDYNPNEKGGQNTCKGTTFMDRYLGATSAKQAYVGSIGLLYQWGRKDPFSSSSTTQSTKEKEHYNIDNKTIKARTTEPVSRSENLQNAIKNPTTFYSHPTDWYSNNSLNNSYLWINTDGTKGIYDPCPEGWRLPSDNSVWKELRGKGQHFDKGKGPEWEDFGYYHTSGRISSDGNLEETGQAAYIWSAKNFYEDQAYYLGIDDYNTYPDHMTKRSNAQSVRCIKGK